MATGASRSSGGFLSRAVADVRSAARQLAAMGVFPDALTKTLSAIGGYDAAKTVRSKSNWTLQDQGPNATVAANGQNLRARARDLRRNNGTAARICNVLARSVVGTGILPRAVEEAPRAVDPADGTRKPASRRATRLQKQANAVWKAWGKKGVADIEGQHTLDALTVILAAAWIGDGEVFCRRRWDKSAGPVPLRLQVLEADMLDEGKNGTLTAQRALATGGFETVTTGRIIQGIELNASGRRTAYWFREQHPSDGATSGYSYTSVRVPAEDVIHLFLPLRPGQLRGLPFIAPAMVTMRDLGDFQGYELIRKKTESLVVGVATSPANNDVEPAIDPVTGAVVPVFPSVRNAAGDVVASMSAGAFLNVQDGTDIKFNSPQISSNYGELTKLYNQGIAAACDVTYEDATSDLSKVNYSSFRAGRIQFNAHIDALQWLWFIPTVMDTLWLWCMEAANLTGAIPKAIIPVEWATPKRLSVDPLKDIAATEAAIQAGLLLQEDAQAELGYDPALFRERRGAEVRADFDEGVVYTTSQPQPGARRELPPPEPPADPDAEPAEQAA